MSCSLAFYALGGGGVVVVVGGHTSICDFFTAQKLFISLKEVPKQALCSLLTSDMLDIASNSTLKPSCIVSGTSVAGTRKW